MPETKLAAILSADVQGYTRAMDKDEGGALRDLQEIMPVVTRIVGQHSGRIFKTMGDGFLADFGSAANAIQCAVGIQQSRAQEKVAFPSAQPMEFRIGIEVGEVYI